MHAPLSVQDDAHLREASGPAPVRTIPIMPVVTSRGFASAIPAGSMLGHASTHLPQRTQASSIWQRAAPAVPPAAPGEVAELERLELVQSRPDSPAEVRYASH